MATVGARARAHAQDFLSQIRVARGAVDGKLGAARYDNRRITGTDRGKQRMDR